MKLKYFTIMGASLLMAMQSCVTDDFDLSKDVELSVNFAPDGFTVGGSNSVDIPLSEVIELSDSGQLKADTLTGDYYFYKMGDDMEPTEVIIGQGSLCGGTDQELNYRFKSGGVRVTTADRFGMCDLRFSTKLNIDYEPDKTGESIQDIHYLVSPTKIEIYTEFSEVADFTDNVTLTYSVPSFYDLKDPSQLTETLLIDDLRGQHYHVIELEGVNFKKTDLAAGEVCYYDADNYVLVMKGTIGITGEAKIKLEDYNKTADPMMNAHISVGTLGVMEVTGRFKKTETVQIDPITFDDLPDFIRDEEVVIDVENPIVRMTLKNEVPAKVNMNAVMTAFKDDRKIADLKVGDEYGTDKIIFDGAPFEQDVNHTKETTVWITRIPIEVPEGEKNVVVSNMMQLISKMPDRIEVLADVSTDPSEVVTLTLAKEYYASPSYELWAPLKIGPKMKIVYTKDMEDLHKDLKDTNVGEIVFKGDVTNNIPLELTLKMTPLDENGNELTGIEIDVPQPIPGEGKKSIEFRMRNNAANDMQKVDRITVKAYAESSEAMAGKYLNVNQNLRIDNAKITLKNTSVNF